MYVSCVLGLSGNPPPGVRDPPGGPAVVMPASFAGQGFHAADFKLEIKFFFLSLVSSYHLYY